MIGNRQIKSSSLQDWKEPIDLKKKKSKSRTRRVNEGKREKKLIFTEEKINASSSFPGERVEGVGVCVGGIKITDRSKFAFYHSPRIGGMRNTDSVGDKSKKDES